MKCKSDQLIFLLWSLPYMENINPRLYKINFV